MNNGIKTTNKNRFGASINLKTGVITVIVCTIATTTIFIQRQIQVKLKTEMQKQILQLRHENERLSNLMGKASKTNSLDGEYLQELMQLRGEVTRLHQQEKDLVRLTNEITQLPVDSANTPQNGQVAGMAEVKITPIYLPKDTWSFAGYSDPQSALQTTLWAASNTNIGTYLASVTDDEKARMLKRWQGKTESDIAAQTSDELQKLMAIRIIDLKTLAEDKVILNVYIEGQGVEYKAGVNKVGEQWKFDGWVNDLKTP